MLVELDEEVTAGITQVAMAVVFCTGAMLLLGVMIRAFVAVGDTVVGFPVGVLVWWLEAEAVELSVGGALGYADMLAVDEPTSVELGLFVGAGTALEVELSEGNLVMLALALGETTVGTALMLGVPDLVREGVTDPV